MIAETPPVQIINARLRRSQIGGCHVRTPEHDRHGLKTDCPATADRLVVHVDATTEHGPYCARHARERAARCLAHPRDCR